MPGNSGRADEFVGEGLDFIPYLLDAEYHAGAILCDEPIPKRRAEVEAVMQILGGNEYVGVQQVRHQKPTPRFCASS